MQKKERVFEDLFGVSLPLIQAPMAGVQGSELAIAVCNAGGLGSLPCAMLDVETMATEISAVQLHTSGPFNVNFFCHKVPERDRVRETEWRQLLAPYFAELDIDPNSIVEGPGRLPFNRDTADVVSALKPPVVSFHFGLPDVDLFSQVKATGAIVLASATTVDEALWLEEQGVDAIIAQGLEAGGHRGSFLSDDISRQMGTFALISQFVNRVKIPVIAAGGVASAEGAAAAVTLGAAGVQVGTTYLLCPEVNTTAIHRAALKSPASVHTAVTNLLSGRPARGIVNRLIRELGPLNPGAPGFPMAATALAPLRAACEKVGRGDFSPLWAGQNTGGCREIPAADLTRELVRLL